MEAGQINNYNNMIEVFFSSDKKLLFLDKI